MMNPILCGISYYYVPCFAKLQPRLPDDDVYDVDHIGNDVKYDPVVVVLWSLVGKHQPYWGKPRIVVERH